MSEKIIWNKLRSGDSKALEQIYRTYFQDIYIYGKKFTKDLGAIEDCIQELFIDLWAKREGLSETDSIKPYLYVAFRRRLFKSIKKTRLSTDTEPAERHFSAVLAIEDLIIDQEMQLEKKNALQTSFTALTDRQKEILYLKFYAGLNYEDISEIMDLNYQSARNLVSRALMKLSKQLLILFFVFFYLIKLSTVIGNSTL